MKSIDFRGSLVPPSGFRNFLSIRNIADDRQTCSLSVTKTTSGMHEAPILVQGEVIEALKPELYQVRLPNGKTTLGHLSRALRTSAANLECGDLVEMEMTPFDFDSGRIGRVLN